MVDNIREIEIKRFQFLKRLYELYEKDYFNSVQSSELGRELGYSDKETEKIKAFLSDEKLIQCDIVDGIKITHKGIVTVEDVLSKQDESIPNSQTIYNVSIGHMEHSQFQQGTNQSSQVFTYTNNELELIQKFVTDLREKFPELNLGAEKLAEVEPDLTTIMAQIQSTRPKSTIINECLISLRTILEGIAGNVVASALLQQLLTII